MPQWLPGGMCCWQWTCVWLRWWAELKDGPVTFRPHSLSCSYFLSVWPYWKSRTRLSDQTPTYWFELVKIHLDGFKNNQNSWVILVLFFACFLLTWLLSVSLNMSTTINRSAADAKVVKTQTKDISHRSGASLVAGGDSTVTSNAHFTFPWCPRHPPLEIHDSLNSNGCSL